MRDEEGEGAVERAALSNKGRRGASLEARTHGSRSVR